MPADEPQSDCDECGHPITAHQAAVTRHLGPCAVCGCRAIEPQFDSRVAAVLALHSKRQFSGDGYGWALCAECRQSWPCATVRAIEMADG
jgi:hypothetical protein